MDEQDFAEFFRVMYPRLVAYARRECDLPTAQDLAAASMETLWRKHPPSPRSDADLASLQSLSFSILRGHARNAARARQRGRALADRVGNATAHRVEPPEVAEAPRWLGRLNERDREVLALSSHGYAPDEIAVILGCSDAAATKRLTRARARARRLLEGRETDAQKA